LFNNDIPDISAFRKRLIAVFVVVALAAAAGGLLYHAHYKARLRLDAEKLIFSIQRIRLEQIRDWRKSRLNEVQILLEGPALRIYLDRFAANNTDRAAADLLRKRLQSYVKVNRYDSAALIDRSGKALVYAGADGIHLCPGIKDLLSKSVVPGAPLMGDFHEGSDGSVHLGMIAHAARGPAGRDMLLVMRVPPEIYLYPLLQTWHGGTETGETLLVRRDGDDVLFLNELRHRKGTAMKLRIPLSNYALPAAVALRGFFGIVVGPDYRGVKVLASVSPIPDTDWALVTKMDWEEVMSGAGMVGILLSLTVLSLLGIAAAAALMLLRQQTARYDGMIRESELRYSRLYQGMRDSFVRVTMDGTIVDCNEAYRRLTGYTDEELKNITYQQLTPERWHTMEGRIVREQIIPRGYSDVYEKEYLRKDGKLAPVEFLTSLETDAAGKPAGMWAIVRDVSERKAAVAALEKAKDYAESLIQTANAMVIVMDAEGRVTTFSKEAEKVTGYTREELEGRSWFETIVPKDRYPEVWDEFNRLMAGGFPARFDNPILTKSGEERYISWQNSQLTEDGRVTGTLSFGMDITERRRAEAALKESEQRFRQLFEAMAEGFAVHEMICDAEGRPVDYRFIEVNPAFERLTGLKKADIIGRTCLEVMPSIEKTWIENYGRVALGGEPMHFESASSALEKVYEVNAFCPGKGQFAVSFFDVTERRRAEREIETLNKTLLEKNREMENFLYITTHDLRSPLVNIQGFSQNLQQYFGEIKELAAGLPAGDRPRAEELAGQKIPESLKFMLESSSRMDAMLTALLKVSRLGRQELKPERVDAGKFLRTITDTMNFQLREAGAEVKIGQLPLCRADALSVSQMFGNLLDNAVKYRDPARPLVIEISGEEAVGKAVYRFRDNGRGIAAGDLDRIWDIFSAQKGAGEKKGEGIGLHMVKRMAGRNGGSIRAESQPGQGSVFILELPVWEG
jgi:PAS domain S-box-containing protein